VSQNDGYKWVPLDVRDGRTPIDEWNVVFEGVPDHLHSSLIAWASAVVPNRGYLEQMRRRLRLSWAPVSGGLGAALGAQDGDEQLRFVDAVVYMLYVDWERSYESTSGRRGINEIGRMLDDMLYEADSAWKVSTDGTCP
jgi:hypothetical protein